MSEIDRLLRQIESTREASERRTKNTNVLADADPMHEIADNTVTKSHALSRAYYRFGLVEKRCMEALISKLNPMRSDNDIQHIELSALEYRAAFPDSGKHAYDHLVNAVDALLNRVIVIPENEDKLIKMTLTVQAVYERKEGRITVAFNPLIVPHLLGLRQKFSSYPLRKTVNFSSSYTWRFYEILVSWVDKKKSGDYFVGWIDSQNVEELREMLGVPDSYKWSDFQKQVLDVVGRELKEKANIFVHFERKKTGRKITHLNIKFIEDDQQQLPLGGARSQIKRAD